MAKQAKRIPLPCPRCGRVRWLTPAYVARGAKTKLGCRMCRVATPCPHDRPLLHCRPCLRRYNREKKREHRARQARQPVVCPVCQETRLVTRDYWRILPVQDGDLRIARCYRCSRKKASTKFCPSEAPNNA